MKNRVMIPTDPMIMPGMMKDKLHWFDTKAAAMSVPKMLPRDVCEFQMPKMRPVSKELAFKITEIIAYLYFFTQYLESDIVLHL